jgi:RimJ/RimL family protein N-acetyltransferase
MANPAVIEFTVQVPAPEYGPVLPYSVEQADGYLDMLIRQADRRSYAIELDGVHVGNVGLKELDWRQRRAECFVEIGAVDVRRRGVAFSAMTQLLDLAFDEFQLKGVRLGVFEFNKPAIALYRKLGFVDDGRHGDHYAQGRCWAVLAMKVGEVDWRAQRLSW